MAKGNGKILLLILVVVVIVIGICCIMFNKSDSDKETSGYSSPVSNADEDSDGGVQMIPQADVEDEDNDGGIQFLPTSDPDNDAAHIGFGMGPGTGGNLRFQSEF